METRKMISKDYLSLEWSAYFADYNWDYIILRDKDPWEVYYRKLSFGMPTIPPEASLIHINDTWGWEPVEMDVSKLEKYLKTRAKPETWKKVTRRFYETHQTACILDGPCLEINLIKSNGKKKQVGYLLYEFPEEWHPSYQKACRLMRYLQRYGKKGKSGWAGFYASRGFGGQTWLRGVNLVEIEGFPALRNVFILLDCLFHFYNIVFT